MLYRETIVVCFEMHAKYMKALYGQKVELQHVKRGSIYSTH
jgi:hypothetical protein